MDKVTGQCPQTTTFLKRRAEAVSNRGPSAYQSNTLPLGQTGSRKEYPFSGVPKSGRVWRKVPESDARSVITLRASLSGTFLQILPELLTPLKGHSLSPRSCPATRQRPLKGLGTNQTPNTGLRHPSFNHCPI